MWRAQRRRNAVRLGLRSGEVVEVRTRAEILSTLDADGRLDGLPFMPEMLDFCGGRFVVRARADKICDTVGGGPLRRMFDAVHLETRCTGAAHGNCQAECNLVWKEAWLRRVRVSAADARRRAAHRPESAEPACSIERLYEATRRSSPETSADVRYQCQATEMRAASRPLRWWNVMQYIRDVRSGNVRVSALAKSIGWSIFDFTSSHLPGYRLQMWLFNRVQRSRGGSTYVDLAGPLTRTPSVQLGLQPGDHVRVRPAEEIRDTLDAAQRNRGLYFDVEMVPYCGKTFEVRSRVNRIIDEKTGKMLTIGSDCLILEGAVCSGRYHRRCPREIFPYWREIWLEPVPAGADENGNSSLPTAYR